jgi:hypothetical protein
MPRKGGRSRSSKKRSGGGKARSAITGRYVSKATAARWPKNTVTEKK